jgi:hypothetical protein
LSLPRASAKISRRKEGIVSYTGPSDATSYTVKKVKVVSSTGPSIATSYTVKKVSDFFYSVTYKQRDKRPCPQLGLFRPTKELLSYSG